MSGKKVFCGHCGAELHERADESPRIPCDCGSVARRIEVEAFDAILQPRSGIMVKKYLGGKSKKKGLVLTVKTELPTYRQDGLPVRETQVIDRENDRYVHKITDEEGNVLYENPKGERLTEHRGFGSGKKALENHDDEQTEPS